MTLQSVRKVFLALCLLVVFLSGVWVVVANGSHLTSLNLILFSFPAVSSGVIVLVAFASGALCGLVMALVAFRVLPMHFQLRRSRKELEILRQQQNRPNNTSS